MILRSSLYICIKVSISGMFNVYSYIEYEQIGFIKWIFSSCKRKLLRKNKVVYSKICSI